MRGDKTKQRTPLTRTNDRRYPDREHATISVIDPTGEDTTIVIIPRDELIGFPLAVRFESRKNEVYVSPAVMKLIEDEEDFRKLRRTLKVRLYRGRPREAVFKNIQQRRDELSEKEAPNHARP